MFDSKEKDILEDHKIKLIEHLFSSNNYDVPKVLFNNKAENFIRKHAKNGENINTKNLHGYFVREFDNLEGLDPKDIQIGVVCIMNNNIGTLAHELRHAFQCQHCPELLPNTPKDKKAYEDSQKSFNKSKYYKFPAEKDAFTFAIQYLNSLNGDFRLIKLSYRFKIACIKSIYKFLGSLMVALVLSNYVLDESLYGLQLNEIYIKILRISFAFILLFISINIACRVSLNKEHYKKLNITDLINENPL